MDIKEIRQLVKLMSDNDLTELNIKEGDMKIYLRRGGEEVKLVGPAQMAMPAQPAGAPAPAGPAAAPVQPAEKPAAAAENLLEIKSPMVGTFYSASSPDSDPYVTEGAKVSDETIVCIVEAMKVMNEIKAECSGTIAEVCVKNAQPVEFGQVLYKVRP